MTSEDIERPVQHSRGCDNVQEEEDNHSSEPDKSFQLQAALAAAQSTWKSGSPDLDLIAEKLADESRDGQFTLLRSITGVVLTCALQHLGDSRSATLDFWTSSSAFFLWKECDSRFLFKLYGWLATHVPILVRLDGEMLCNDSQKNADQAAQTRIGPGLLRANRSRPSSSSSQTTLSFRISFRLYTMCALTTVGGLALQTVSGL